MSAARARRHGAPGQGEADRCASRADTTEHYEQHRKNPGVTLRRLERLQADRRGVERQQARTVDGTGGVERSLAWMMHARRHARDYERLIQHSETLITWAAITLMTRRLAGKGATPSWPRKPTAVDG